MENWNLLQWTLDRKSYYAYTAKFLTPLVGGNNLLSIGCGDGSIEDILMKHIECKIIGLEVIEYSKSKIPIHLYNGKKIPFNKKFDYTMFIYSLHHTETKDDILKLLKEAKRVSKEGIIILDHAYSNLFDKILLAMWDYFINKTNNDEMKISFNFLKENEWSHLFKKLDLKVKVKFYPYFSTIFFKLLI